MRGRARGAGLLRQIGRDVAMGRKNKTAGAAPSPTKRVTAASLLKSAEEWAVECGLCGPLHLGVPEKVEYPRFGFGYVVLVTEKDPHKPGAKVRMGSARFNEKGERTMWTLDGSVVL